MRPKKSAAEDDWSAVKDSRRRKQIQDRLAQRARRERLAKAAKSSTQVSESQASRVSPTPERLPSEPFNGATVMDLRDPSLESTSRISVASLSMKLYEADSSAATESIISSDHRLITPPNMTVCSAMYTNGRILGLTCACSLVSKSLPQPPEVPQSLQPLPIQLNRVHFQFIDRFPLPRLRERMIILADDFNSEEFVADLFGMPTFTIAAGAQPWDGEAWSAEPEFIEKWGFLLE